uniref:Uncharacterized protein n=1 Tax=viral metagenome TaxID=1070528 RepID=A0A6M3LX93_9ZZZZ
MPTLIPEKRDACMKEMAGWFAEHRKTISFEELTPILQKHFPLEADAHEFTDYLDSPGGQAEFKKRLRLEAWKAVRPEEEKPVGIAGAERKFPLGQIVMTRGVNDLVAENTEFAKFTIESLRRHAGGDWGDLGPEDKRENEYSLTRHLRLLSAYEKPPLPKIWIITEADRSVTTTLFPSEY